MSRFLRLTDAIINKNVIHHIHIKKDKYIIHFMTNKTNSFFLLGGGGSTSYNTECEVCKTKHPIDYKTVTDWIDNNLD